MISSEIAQAVSSPNVREEEAKCLAMIVSWGADPDSVLAALRSRSAIEKVKRGKTFSERLHEIPRSYGKNVTSLSSGQKLKVFKLWELLDASVRSAVLAEAQAACTADANLAATHLTSDEACRILHLLNYPGAAALWTKTRSSYDRITLDAMHLGSQSSRDEVDPYVSLADLFYNDPDVESDFNKSCFNPVIKYGESGVAEVDLAGKPKMAVDTDGPRGNYDNIYPTVCDIDPTQFSENIREKTPEWIKKTSKKVMSQCANVADMYLRSGNQEAACEYTEWMRYILFHSCYT
jgi:hypothetical protein